MNRPARRLSIPLVRRAPRETLLLAHPWFLRDAASVPDTASPRLLQFGSDRFMEDFLAGIERSGAERDPDAFDRLLSFRDYAEPPDAMLDEHGEPLFPAVLARDPDPANVLGDDQEPPQAGWLRKLYLPLHQYFHLVAVELHCRRAGYPRLAPQRVLEAGLIVRRLVADRQQPRWEDWIAVEADKGLWLEVADAQMRPLAQGGQAQPLDPRQLSAAFPPGVDCVAPGQPLIPVEAECVLRARAGLGVDEALPDSLAVVPMSPLPATVGEGGQHTVRFAYLPLGNGELQLPPFADPASLSAEQVAELLAQRAAAQLRAEWLDDRPASPGDAGSFVATLRSGIQAPLRQLLESLLLPPRPAPASVVAATLAMQALRGTGFDIGQASANPAESARHTLQRAMWQVSDDAGEVDDWWARVLGDATALAAADRPTDAGWDPDHFYAGFDSDLDILMRDRLHAIADDCAPASGSPATHANDDPPVLHLLGVLLRRLRACRRSLMAQINDQVLPAGERPDLWRQLPEPGVAEADADDYPVVTAGSLADGIEAWLAADAPEARAEMPRPWPPLSVNAFWRSVHQQAYSLEQRLAAVDQRGAASGVAYLEACASLRQERNDLLNDHVLPALLSGTSAPRSAGDELRIVGLDLAGQPEMGLLVFPGPAPTVDSVESMIDAVVGRYTVGSSAPDSDDQRAEAARLLNLVRPRFDADSLYAVWCFARVAGRDDCEAEQLLWTPASEVFSLAEPTDVLGVRPVAMQLPDLKKLVRDIPRIPKARANPFAAVNIPPDSGVSAGEDMADTARQWGIQMICSFGIPVFTICAWVLFSIILSILLMIPGFGWLLLLKFCLPVPAKK